MVCGFAILALRLASFTFSLTCFSTATAVGVGNFPPNTQLTRNGKTIRTDLESLRNTTAMHGGAGFTHGGNSGSTSFFGCIPATNAVTGGRTRGIVAVTRSFFSVRSRRPRVRCFDTRRPVDPLVDLWLAVLARLLTGFAVAQIVEQSLAVQKPE